MIDLCNNKYIADLCLYQGKTHERLAGATGKGDRLVATGVIDRDGAPGLSASSVVTASDSGVPGPPKVPRREEAKLGELFVLSVSILAKLPR